MNTQNNLDFTICPAQVNDARDLVELIVMAGEGLPLRVWEDMRENGESVMDVGYRRATRTKGSFSYRNADVALQGRDVISAIVSYPLPVNMQPGAVADVSPLFRPLVELENMAISTWYINMLASYPEARGQGAASALMVEVGTRAHKAGYEWLSLIVRDRNPAKHLYEKHGFRELGRAEMYTKDLGIPTGDWVLMIKNTDQTMA